MKFIFSEKFAFGVRVAPLYWLKIALAKAALAIWPGLAPKMALVKGG